MSSAWFIPQTSAVSRWASPWKGQLVSVRLSPWRLAHLFKSEIGMSPQRYLTLVRLQRAKDRLASGFLPVQEIAISVGIPNPSQFTKTFKQITGQTPAQFRKTTRSR